VIIEVKKEDTYVPRWNGNDQLPEEEQIKVHHRYLMPGERKKYLYTKPIVLDMKTGEVDQRVEYVQDERGIVETLITKIDNLSIKNEGKEQKVTSGKDLYTMGVPHMLVTEIEQYMIGVSPEVDTDFLG